MSHILEVHTLFITNHYIRKLLVEFRNIYRIFTAKGKFPKEFFNLKGLYMSEQYKLKPDSIKLQPNRAFIACYACVSASFSSF